MKKHVLAAIFIALGTAAFAERPSSDELAVRLGVRGWFLMHSTNTDAFGADQLKAIYQPDVAFTDPTSAVSAQGHGLKAYAALWKPLSQAVQKSEIKPGEDIQVSLQPSRAVTTFTFHPEGACKDGRPLTCHTRVSLTWERRDGIWKIAREELTPLAPAPATAIVTAK